MGDPKKAEARQEHFAAVTSPAMIAVPFGQRFALAVPAVSFQFTTLESSTSFGNSYPLFLKRTIATDYTTASTFKPDEGLTDNPVDDSLATCHGHMGKIVSPQGPLPGMINCGVRPSDAAKCRAQIEALLGLIAQKMADELSDPLKFYQNFKKGEATVLDVLKKDAVGVWDSVVSAYEAAKAKEARIAALPWREQLIERGKEALRQNPAFSPTMWLFDNQQSIADAAGWAKEIFNATRGKSGKELYAAVSQWLEEKLGKLTCGMVDALAAIAGSKKPIAEQLGELQAVVDAEAIEIGALLLGDIALTKGRALLSTKVIPWLSRAGRSLTRLAPAITRGGARTVAAEGTGGAALTAEQAAARAGVQKAETAAPTQAAKAEQQAARREGDSIEGQRRDGQLPPCVGCP